jgi:hypothetical protein
MFLNRRSFAREQKQRELTTAVLGIGRGENLDQFVRHEIFQQLFQITLKAQKDNNRSESRKKRQKKSRLTVN